VIKLFPELSVCAGGGHYRMANRVVVLKLNDQQKQEFSQILEEKYNNLEDLDEFKVNQLFSDKKP
jgi:hypothetical protein